MKRIIRALQNLSLRRKQMLIMMLTSSVALLLACLAFLVYDVVSFRHELTLDVGILAEVVGDNCAALIDFNDEKTAGDTLATLREQNNIVAACVYNKDGKVFAVYQRDKTSAFVPPAVRPAGHEFTGNELHLFGSITQHGQSTGTIFVASDMDALAERLGRYGFIVGVVFLGSLIAVFFLSNRLQRLISSPILRLLKTTRAVTLQKNYSVRVAKDSNDELGQLIEGFNEMLSQIQQRDSALEAARDDLEVRVEKRTAELASANDTLQERTRLATLEAEIGSALTRGGTLSETLSLCCEAMVRNLDAAFARIWTLNEREKMLELQASAGMYTHLNGPHGRVPVGKLKIGLIAEERKPHLTNQVVGDPRVSDQEWAKREGMVAFAGYPLLVEGRLMGVAAMFARHSLTELTLKGLASISNNIALGIERKQAEENLLLLSSAVEQSRESIVITDAQLDLPGPKIVFVNPAFTKMTGYTAAEAIGKTPRMLQGERSDKATLKRLRETLGRGESFHGETVNYRKDGTEFDLEWQIAPIRNASGTIIHFVAIQRDITERRRMEARLFQSQKMETVGRLAGGVAHEFNSIMTAIIGQSELVLHDLPAGSPLRRNANEIHQAADRAAALTRQLLAYGRKQILQPAIIDLNAIVTGMESTLRHLVGRDVNLHIAVSPEPKPIRADAGQIEQVVVNIVMNATDAMPNGGKLTLETGEMVLDQDYVSQFPDLKAGDYVMLAITDTGTGMSESVKARIFEPFFTTKEVGKGTGLGLATCHGIIKQSEGHINVYSESGRGATFKIYLPKAQPEKKPAIQPIKSPDLPRGTETVLLVEDDPALREMAATLLRRLGYTVHAAADGIEALNVTHQRGIGHIDLLFTDVVMPHMSGKELSDRIRSLYPKTRILFTSAYTENAIVHQGVLNPGVILLQKPFTPAALARKVRQVLDAAN